MDEATKCRSHIIECIKVKKVYDWCCQEERLTLCFQVECVTPGQTIESCKAEVTACVVESCTPDPLQPGFAFVVFRKTIVITVVVDGGERTSAPLVHRKRVRLCAPPDPDDPNKCDPRMQFECESRIVCSDCLITGPNTVCCTIVLCECFESEAPVKLKVKSYGFCEPRSCEIPPEIECPPRTPFPPQCEPRPIDP